MYSGNTILAVLSNVKVYTSTASAGFLLSDKAIITITSSCATLVVMQLFYQVVYDSLHGCDEKLQFKSKTEWHFYRCFAI